MARTLLSAPPTDRVGRYPKHTFRVNALPFTAQPFMLARVLPGETMSNLFMEARCVTDPINNPIIGWKQEFFFFYCRATDLMLDVFKDMFVDPTNAEMAGHDLGANSLRTYAAKGAVDWTAKCLDRVVETYFRDDGETASQFSTAAGDRIVQIRENTFLDTLTDKDLIPDGDLISAATDMGDLDRLMDAFEMLRSMGIANMTYEDWLRSQGINIPGKDENKPEMLARFSDYQYPSNTIDPVTGAPSSAVSWVFKNGSRDPKMFKEPGFVIGITVTRPKVYFAGLAGSAAGFAQRAWDWMPNYMHSMPETSLRQFGAGAGPLGDRTTDTDSYWLDMRDELIYGDQFQNHTAFNVVPATVGAEHLLALPDTSLNWKYPSEAMCKSFFKSATTQIYNRMDGYCSLSIKGLQVDYTRGNFAEV